MEVIVSPKEFGIEESKAVVIEQSFLPKVVERDGLISVYENLLTKEINKETCVEAGNLRRKLVKVRTGIADIHKTEKAFYLASGRYVDALKNKHTLPIEQMEEKLAEIEKYFENQEKERIAKLQADRELELQPYEVENVSALSLGIMSDGIWAAFLTGTKTNYEAKKEAARIEAERMAAELKAERERIEAQRIENERLKKEAEEREKVLQAEREAAAAALKAQQDKAAAEAKAAADKLEAERKEAARLAKIEADKAAAIKAESDRLAAELQAKKEAEAKAEADRIAAEKKAAKAPVKEKMRIAIHALTLQLPESELTADIMAKFDGFKTWATKQIESL